MRLVFREYESFLHVQRPKCQTGLSESTDTTQFASRYEHKEETGREILMRSTKVSSKLQAALRHPSLAPHVVVRHVVWDEPAMCGAESSPQRRQI